MVNMLLNNPHRRGYPDPGLKYTYHLYNSYSITYYLYVLIYEYRVCPNSWFKTQTRVLCRHNNIGVCIVLACRLSLALCIWHSFIYLCSPKSSIFLIASFPFEFVWCVWMPDYINTLIFVQPNGTICLVDNSVSLWVIKASLAFCSTSFSILIYLRKWSEERNEKQ